MKKKKILLIADDLRSHSGVSHVSREFVKNACHHYDFITIAGSIKHPQKGQILDVSADFNKMANIEDANVKIIPADGYGDPDLMRFLLKTEKPDAIFFITDPRYYIWLFQMEDEIRKQCPLIYLNIWDSPVPYPLWNKPYYESCDLLLAISKQTKNINQTVLKDLEVIDLDKVLEIKK
jgi:hypothetical protein